MYRYTITGVFALLLGMLLIVFVVTKPAVTQEGVKELKIGVVDTSQVRRNCLQVQEIVANLEKLKNETEERIKELQKEIMDLQGTLKFLKEGSESYEKTQYSLFEKQANLNYLSQYMQELLSRKGNNAYLDFYKDMNEVIGEYASQRGYDLILKVSNIGYEGSSEKEIFLQIAQHKVLYYSDDVDISDEIVRALNERFEKQATE
ncbi:MAG: OmpH family outer membrane protein [Armatimonadetes bacterium]|nr:OmpH family outer membrane protein [Armatimonadota bacterium]